MAGGSTLYDHAIGIYRSTSPFFTKATTEFLGYPIVNDQAYDARYLDTPSIPTTDVYRTTYGAGLTKYSAIYSSMSAAAVYTQSLARGSLPPNPCLDSIFGPLSFSFSIQFDTLVDGESVFSVGNAANDGAPRWLVCIQTTADGKVISAFTGAGYEYTNLGLAINTPYKVVVTDDLTLTKVYINGILRGTFVGRNNNLHINNLYIADGFPGTKPLDGFISDFRVYPKVLTLDEMMRLKIGI